VVATAIAAQLAQAGQVVMQIGLAGGNRVQLPVLTTPKQVWPGQVRPPLPSAPPALVAQDIALAVTPEGQLEVIIDDQAPLRPERLVIASARAAALLMPQLNVKLPLRPVRCHVVNLAGAGTPEPVTYLSRGSIFNLGAPAAILYDGLIDPRQATYLQMHDLAVQGALGAWLAKRGLEAAGVPQVVTTATTPDYLPAFGAWEGQPQLWLAVGWHVWGASVAGSMAAKLAEMMLKGEVVTDVDMSRLNPARFHTGNWQKTPRPAWLPEFSQPQLVGGLKDVTHADTVNTVNGPTVERAGTVKTADGPITQRAQVQTRPAKPKVQTGGLSQMVKSKILGGLSDVCASHKNTCNRISWI